jgi:hypothetical protein
MADVHLAANLTLNDEANNDVPPRFFGVAARPAGFRQLGGRARTEPGEFGPSGGAGGRIDASLNELIAIGRDAQYQHVWGFESRDEHPC